MHSLDTLHDKIKDLDCCLFDSIEIMEEAREKITSLTEALLGAYRELGYDTVSNFVENYQGEKHLSAAEIGNLIKIASRMSDDRGKPERTISLNGIRYIFDIDILKKALEECRIN